MFFLKRFRGNYRQASVTAELTLLATISATPSLKASGIILVVLKASSGTRLAIPFAAAKGHY